MLDIFLDGNMDFNLDIVEVSRKKLVLLIVTQSTAT